MAITITQVQEQLLQTKELHEQLCQKEGGSERAQAFRKDSIKYLARLIKELEEELIGLNR